MFPNQIIELERVNKKFNMIRFSEKEMMNDMVGHIIYYKDRISKCDYCNVNGINGWSGDCKICGNFDRFQQFNNIVNVNYLYVLGIEIYKNRIHRIFGLFGNTPEDCLNKKKKDSDYPIKSSFMYRGSFLISATKYKTNNII